MLDEIGIDGQQRLLASHALVIGAGGLGSPVALYLGSAGVGRITVVDHDDVDLTNLQRQIAHDTVAHRPAQGRVDARGASRRSTPRCECRRRRAARRRRRCSTRWCRGPTWCSTAATTSPPATRSTRACVRHRKPLVSGAAIGLDAQVSVYDTREPTRRATPACSRPTRLRGRRLRDDGRVRAAGRHRRQRAGGRGAEAAGRLRHARWPAGC